MAKYPRVEFSTTVNKRSSARPAVEDTTTLLGLCIADKGPTEITAVHSLSEFISIFGELDYKKNGQTALNIYNWLSNGGTVYVCRLATSGANTTYQYTPSGENPTSVGGLGAKYPGIFYNDLVIDVTKETSSSKNYYTFNIKKKDGNSYIQLEKFVRVLEDKLADTLGISEYITITNVEALKGLASSNTSYTFNKGIGYSQTATNIETAIQAINWTDNSIKGIDDPLLVPAEVVLGAGYSATTDAKLLALRNTRKDIVVILDSYDLSTTSAPALKADYNSNNKFGKDAANGENAQHTALFDQYFKIYDNIFVNSNIYVTATYFLSKLMPYNDNIYGIQYPVAGLRRGILEGVLEIHDNLSSTEKDTNFTNRVNYAEKTTREVAFMGNRTHDGSNEFEYTALSFLNNVRTLERMRKEIARYGREYLFEFNDSATLSQLSNILNKYINNWIANRALTYGFVTVEKDEYSDERINVGLNVRFAGTVEVIHVDIVLD